MNTRRRTSPGLNRAGAVGVVLTLVVLSGAACGKGNPSPAVASIAANASTPSASATASQGDPLAFAQCMRAHGVPDFPDPATGRSVLPKGIDPNSPAFRAANDTCKQYLSPDQGSLPSQDSWSVANKLKYSQCMRAHGLPTFPDPEKDGGLQFDQSIDPNSQQFKNAEKACSQYEPQNGNGGQGGAP